MAAPPMNDPRVKVFLEWLCTPKADREPSSQKELAAMIGASEETLRGWKKDPDFLAAWEAQFRKTVGAPERIQSVLDALYRTATDESDPRQVPAARTYLEAVDKARPPKNPGTVAQAKELTDEQLLTILAERAAHELNQRPT